jgi:arginyl-tRNA synthetase
MSILSELKARFYDILADLSETPDELIDMVRTSQDARFGDYQANFAMPLGKKLGRAPRELAAEIVERVELDDLCDSVELAGPGFINMRLRDDLLIDRLQNASGENRLGVEKVPTPKKYVVDYSAPNVAKPMHVGHIRSTVIGDSLSHVLRFLGHDVISDNHIGDWGTQFGMILYGFRNFCDETAYTTAPVSELARLYRLVRQLMDYHGGVHKLPQLEQKLCESNALLATTETEAAAGGEKPDKKTRKSLARRRAAVAEIQAEIDDLKQKLADFQADPNLIEKANAHPDIETAVLLETAKLHSGDEENRQLWSQFLPNCLDEINRVYSRLNIKFDYSLGESFYQDRLAAVVDDLLERGIARESEGAICVFFDDKSVPMLVRKKDGAFLYATTDLATIEYRMENWSPDAILYVVDHRQSMHFEHLFEAVRLLGHDKVELQHISFGTVLGSDGRPFKTRSGDTVGLEGLLDEAVRRARAIVDSNDDGKPGGAELSDEQRQVTAERIGIAALKYADLSQNRTSDYEFSYDKMLAMNGNTATYMQYAYARVRSIFSRGQIDIGALRSSGGSIQFSSPAERSLGLAILRFSEALDMVVLDYRPNQLTSYLFDLAGAYSTFFEQCPVLKAENESLKQSRLLLCDLTSRVIHKGLELLGIEVVEKM